MSPAQVRSSRSIGNDLSISWTRRTRIGGDNWDTFEVPLAEDSERYEVDIYSGATLKRTLGRRRRTTRISRTLVLKK